MQACQGASLCEQIFEFLGCRFILRLAALLAPTPENEEPMNRGWGRVATALNRRETEAQEGIKQAVGVNQEKEAGRVLASFPPQHSAAASACCSRQPPSDPRQQRAQLPARGRLAPAQPRPAKRKLGQGTIMLPGRWFSPVFSRLCTIAEARAQHGAARVWHFSSD